MNDLTEAQRSESEEQPIDHDLVIDLPSVIRFLPYCEGQNFLKEFPDYESFGYFEFPRKGDPEDDFARMYTSNSRVPIALAIQKVIAATEIEIDYWRRYLRRESIAAVEEIKLRNQEQIYRAVTAKIGLEREYIVVKIQY